MIDYDFHFSGFRGLDFTNCFTSLYLYLEGIQGENNYDCAKKQGKPCRYPDCHHRCSLTLANHAEQHFFLFDTISGRSATVHGWGGKPTAIYREIYDTDDMIEFVMGYAGYAYEKHTDNLIAHVQTSLDNGTPVLARLKTKEPYTDVKADSFRLIIGFDGGKLQVPVPKGAQKTSKNAPKPGDIESLYVITGKTECKYTLLDALRRIKRVMDADREAGTWDVYIRAFEDWQNKMHELKLKDFKRLYLFAREGTTWNCHNFAETFRTYQMNPQCPERFGTPVWEELKDPQLGAAPTRTGCPDGDPLRLDPLELINWAFDVSHNTQWALHTLHDIRNWRSRYRRIPHSGMINWSMCDMAITLLRKVKECDSYAYEAVSKMIEILERAS